MDDNTKKMLEDMLAGAVAIMIMEESERIDKAIELYGKIYQVMPDEDFGRLLEAAKGYKAALDRFMDDEEDGTEKEEYRIVE